jgi:flagellar biosynthetic protein FliR
MNELVVQLVPLVLVAFRLSGLFVFAPLLANVSIPMPVKVLLCAAMAVGVFPLVKAPALPADIDFISLAVIAVMEVLVGVVIGLLALIPVAAVQVAGVLMGQQMGLGLAAIYNPALETESDLIGEVLIQLAMVAFLSLGGIEVLFLSVARSFEAVPIGGFSTGWAPVHHVLPMLVSGFDLALRVAAPMLGIILVETIATAMLMKTVPQINVMSLGFGLKILLGLSALILSVRIMDSAIMDHVAQAGRELLWSSGRVATPAGGH